MICPVCYRELISSVYNGDFVCPSTHDKKLSRVIHSFYLYNDENCHIFIRLNDFNHIVVKENTVHVVYSGQSILSKGYQIPIDDTCQFMEVLNKYLNLKVFS